MIANSIFVAVDNYKIHALTYGDKNAPILFTCHGLTRNAWDFDIIAKHLMKDYYVVSFDVLGRGLSSWSKNPKEDYKAIALAKQLEQAIATFNVENRQLRWFGTSMGGMLGIIVCAGRYKTQFSHLILNDIAPSLNPEIVEIIATYSSITPPIYNTITELKEYFKTIHAPFFPMTENDWMLLTTHSYRRTDSGLFTVHQDPAIKYFISDQNYENELWSLFESLDIKIHLFLGGKSELVLPKTVDKMKQLKAITVGIIEEAGHVPMLTRPQDLTSIEDFLKT